MALFKILQGVAENLPSKKTEGYCYVTTDEGKFYIDITETKRICLNAAIADKIAYSLSINGKSFDGSKAIDVGIIGAAYGGSGCATLNASANAFIGALPAVSDAPIGTDYYVSQAVGGGTSYYRRPISALWNYIKGESDKIYLPLTGGTITGTLTVNKELYCDTAIICSLFVAQSNDNPQFMLQNASGVPLGMLYMNTTTGNYSSAQLRVYSSASTYSTFNFGNDGKLSCASLALTTALQISSGGTGATTAANALINLNGNTAKGSATVPIYWTGSAWATITSYSGKASTAGTADKVANALSINGKTYNGSASINVGVIGAAYGGSGQTTLGASANVFLDALPIWTADPTDDTYLIRQDTAGALSYGKVKFNTVYNYIKNKTDTLYLSLSGGTLTGQVTGRTKNGAWIVASHDGAFNMSTAPSGANAASVVTAKTQNGSWGISTLGGSNNLYFVYGTDANYSAGTNQTVNNVYISATGGVYGAVWNDYAEFRVAAERVIFGQVVYSDNHGELHKTTERLQAFEGVVSDTFGFAIGETDKAKTPLAVAGRVLVYPDKDRYTFHAGDAVCAGKNGTVSKMTREEIIAYPDRIVGIVSEIPEYETWGSGNVPVYNRIWIRVK